MHLDKSLDRKSLKKPDGFLKTLNYFFEKLSTQSGKVLIGVAFLLAIGLGIAFWMNHQDTLFESSRNALFLAEKSISAEMKALVPPKAAGIPALPAQKTDAALSDGVTYQKLNVDRQLPKSVELLKAVEHKYGSTRSALDARVKLAGLYFNHGDYAKALPWYQKAIDSSSGFEKAAALSSLGYAFENLGKPLEAIQSYEKAINLGEGSLKGDLLLGIARSYEAAHNPVKARSIYDQILKELPGTEYSKSAELFKESLK